MLNPFKRKSAPAASRPVRDANLAKLNKLGFRVSPSLPLLRDDDQSKLRPRDEIVKRLASLQALCMFVAAPPKKYPDAPLLGMIADHGLDAVMPSEEREIMALDRGKANADHNHTIGWCMENMVPLAWALGNTTEPRIDGEMIGGDELDHILTKFAPNDSAQLAAMLTGNTLRSYDEVDAMEDLFYCAHNAVRSAQIGERSCVPRGFDPIANGGVIHERRHALTWMLSLGVPWEETDQST